MAWGQHQSRDIHRWTFIIRSSVSNVNGVTKPFSRFSRSTKFPCFAKILIARGSKAPFSTGIPNRALHPPLISPFIRPSRSSLLSVCPVRLSSPADLCISLTLLSSPFLLFFSPLRFSCPSLLSISLSDPQIPLSCPFFFLCVPPSVLPSILFVSPVRLSYPIRYYQEYTKKKL